MLERRDREVVDRPALLQRRAEEPLEWNATLLQGDVVEAVSNPKEQPGEDVLIYGSGALVKTLLAHNLIDQCRS